MFKNIDAEILNSQIEFRCFDIPDDDYIREMAGRSVGAKMADASQFKMAETDHPHYVFGHVFHAQVAIVDPDEIRAADAKISKLDFDNTQIRTHNQHLREDLDDAFTDLQEVCHQRSLQDEEIEKLRAQVCRLERENDRIKQDKAEREFSRSIDGFFDY